MTIEEAKKLDHFVCSECSSDDDMKKPQATFSASPGADGKVISCIQHQIIVTHCSQHMTETLVFYYLVSGKDMGREMGHIAEKGMSDLTYGLEFEVWWGKKISSKFNP